MRWKTLAAQLLVIVCASSAAFSGDLARIRSLVEEGRPNEALTDLDAHLEEFPADPEAMFLRALLLAETQREGQAREVFEELSGLRPDRPEPLNNLAVIQAAMGDYGGAVETLKEALRTHPAYSTAYENLTKIYGQLASEAYSRALSVDGAHERSSLELVLLSDMVLPDAAPVRVAQVSSEPLPSTADAVSPTTTQPRQEENPAAQEVGEEAEDELSDRPEPAAPVPPEPAELAALVEAWARAWSEQRVEDYLYFYSQSFVPVGDISREEWQEIRRLRVAAPDFVKVSVAFLDFESGESDRALVRFNQSYESDAFGDLVTKTLELIRESGVWKIVKETVDS